MKKQKINGLTMVLLAMMLLLVAFFAGCGDEQNPVETMGGKVLLAPEKPDDDFVSDEIIVKFQPKTPDEETALIIEKNGAKAKSKILGINAHVLKVPPGQVSEKVQAFKKNPKVVYAEPNYIMYAFKKPTPPPPPPAPVNDPLFSNQWGLTKVKAPDAWTITKGSSAIRIAVLDTGIDQDHEDLAGKIQANANFISDNVDDHYGHGTHCAGIASAVTNNAKGVAGIGYNCSLVNGKVLGDDGRGTAESVANGIIWSIGKAEIISMSLGSAYPSTTIELSVNSAWTGGCLIVAAAGNQNTTAPHYPAYYENCIAVGASDSSDGRASFSNYGSWVDVAAPGVNILSTLPGRGKSRGNYGYLSGTSMATPHVAGLAGLVWTKLGGSPSNASVRNKIETTCDTMRKGGNWVKYGRINAYKAVK